MKVGILLINLGTPDSYRVKDVRRYLRQFLSDPYVIDTHPVVRWLLLNCVILPFRPKNSAEAYQSIWTEQGSPLLVNSQQLAENLQQQLGAPFRVALGMRYGSPSIDQATKQLMGCDKIIVLPLFPQYSLAATETAIQAALDALKPHWHSDKITVVKDFFNDIEFIATQAQQIKKAMPNDFLKDHRDIVLFSYHGLPERQVIKASPSCHQCGMRLECPKITDTNRDCYRAQCYASSAALAQALGLKKNQYQTSFQSRLGRIPWIQPYTDQLQDKLVQQGVENILIACPSFVCDCLETLEEIGIRAAEQWQQAGGKHLILASCVNQRSEWLTALIKRLL